MRRIPQAQHVARAIRAARVAARKSLTALNKVAAQRMAKGDYATTEALAARGREIQQFQAEISALAARWKAISGTRGAGPKPVSTALWNYYQPILQALVAAGGTCRRSEIATGFERIYGVQLQPADRERTSRGRERWQVMIQRCRKLLIAEKWIENRSGPAWVITEAGRRAAERGATKN